MSECSDQEEAPPVVTLWGRQWSREARLARVGRLEKLAGMRLIEDGTGPNGACDCRAARQGRALTSRP